MFRRRPKKHESAATAPKSRILPHTAEAGDPYYIGDIYHRLHPNFASSGSSNKSTEPPDSTPYYTYLENLSQQWPYMRYLVDFMQTTCAPPKDKFLAEKDRLERASRIKGSLLKISPSNDNIERQSFATATELRSALDECEQSPNGDTKFLFLVEDLSRDAIEILGSRLNVDPRFFRGHISDYLWYNTRDPWVELPELELFAAQRNFFNIRFFQPRYFRTSASLASARSEAGDFNVLRRIDVQNDRNLRLDEPSSAVGLIRCKLSLWINSNRDLNSNNIGLLLVDPPIKEGFPLWGGYNYFTGDQRIFTSGSKLKPCFSSSSMSDDLIYWFQNLSQSEKSHLDRDPRLFAFTGLLMAAAGWKTTLEYANTRLTQIEWELENPSFHLLSRYDALDGCLRRLHRWRRVFPVYSSMISEVLSRVLNQHLESDTGNRVHALARDFEALLNQIAAFQRRTESIAHLVGTMISIEENKRVAEQNVSLTRLTYLAFVFIPFTFVASFFSMTSDLAQLTTTIWIYFTVATPLTAICLFLTFYLYSDGSINMRKRPRPQERVQTI